MIVKSIIPLLFLLISGSLWSPVYSQNDCDPDISRRSERAYRNGLSAFQDGDFSEANRHLTQAIRHSEDNYKAHLLLGRININPYFRERNIRRAKESFKEVVRICPQADVRAYYYLGDIHFGREEWSKAADYFQAFLESDLEGQRSVRADDIKMADEKYKMARFYHTMFNNEVPFDPQPVRDVSTSGDEYMPLLSPDQEYMFFTRRVQETPQDRSVVWQQESRSVELFIQAQQRAPNVFNQGDPLEYPFNQAQNQGGASITIDNRYLYMTICKHDDKRNYLNCDIYKTHYEGGSWSAFKNLGENVNNPDTWEAMPSISSDGNTLYFVSDRPGGYGGYDIYISRRQEDGSWGKAQNAGPAINTAGDEASPFIHTDSQTLYFSSRDRYDEANDQWYYGHRGLGGYDIFFIRLGKEGWTEPKNLGYPINTEDDEIGFMVSTDGEKGYFASTKYGDGSMYNIYSFDLYDEARPEKVLFLKGTLKDDDTDMPVEDATIELKNLESKKVTTIDVDRETGNYVAAVPFNADYMMTVNSREHVYESRYISRKSPSYMRPAQVDLELRPFRLNDPYQLNDIYFATDSDELTSESYVVIRDFANFLENNDHISISIYGHTDNVGAKSYNQQLSERRAKSVYNALSEMGIDPGRMDYDGFGETKPVADNNTEEGRAKNRRTEFVITEF